MRNILRGSAAAVAVAVLALSAAGQAPRPADERDYLAAVQDATRRLVDDVQHVQGHLADLPGMKERELYRRADAVLRQALHFQSGLKAGVGREHLYRDFAVMDKELHELVGALRPLAQNARGLQRALASLAQADERLHFVLSQGDASAERRLEVVHRQVHALAEEAEEFHRVVHTVLADDRKAAHLDRVAEAFAKAAAHLHKSLDKNATREHIRRDFASVDKAWHELARHVNDLPPREHSFLRSRAQRLDAIHDRLFGLLGLEGERPRVALPFDSNRP